MSPKRICVSGVTGFIAAHLVKDLLARGYVLHGTARRLSDPSRLAHVTSLPNASENLRLFEADLLTPGAFDEALMGCDLAVHCASPYIMNVKDPQKDLVDPAVKGTNSFLNSCAKVGTVKKVVVTSSITAITDSGRPGKVFDESDWNDKSSLTCLPYYYSKVQAERAVWQFAESHPQINVVVINPTMFIGPSLMKSINASVSPFLGLITGKGGPPGVIDVEWNVVDVRDVSMAHIAAVESDNASGRYLCTSDKPMHLREVVEIIKSKHFPCKDLNLSAGWISKVIKLAGSVSSDQAMVYARHNVANPTAISAERIKRDLNMSFRNPEDTIKEMLDDFVKWGHVPPPKSV